MGRGPPGAQPRLAGGVGWASLVDQVRQRLSRVGRAPLARLQTRLLLDDRAPLLEPVLQKLTHRLASLRVGDPMDKNTDVGAINSREQLG